MSFTARFAVVSLLALAVLGAALVAAMAQLIKQQATDDAVRTAQAYVTNLGTRLTDQMWQDGGLPVGASRNLNSAIGSQDDLVRLRLWPMSGDQPIYDSAIADPDDPGVDPYLRGLADRGQTVSRPMPVEELPTTLRDGNGDTLQVVMPVRQQSWFLYGAEPQVMGVAEVVLDQSDAVAATDEAIRTIALLTLLGAALVWLLLYRTVTSASRRLRQSSEENARLALLDPLTGLPNRRLLNERLENAVHDAARDGKHVGLLLLDIDRFKEINDSLGHDRGDQLLVQVADRLREIVRETDTVARLGGDEFAILLKTVRGVDDAVIFAERVLQAFDEPFTVDEMVLHVETSIGLALFPDHADDVQSLLKLADVAMYIAKAGRRGMSVYDSEGDTNSPARLILLGDLRRALDADDQLTVFFQPKLELETKRIVGLEALLRWKHPIRGMVPPGEFVPLAETTGLVHTLTDRVLRLVLSQLREWREEGFEIPVAVNLSALNLSEPELDRRIAELLAEYGVPARLLEFEITESAIMQDPERAAAMLRRIAAMGSTIALDDFGIGNTSISQLRDLPIDTLKIDRSFIADMDGGNEALVKVVTDLAHEFEMVAVAEGVEEHGIAERLRLLGCDLAQGYLYSRPIPADELPDVIAAYGTVHDTAVNAVNATA
ncbi:MAG: EAL domain-containing protein [Actinobacteria bacterium]|jgi:diguanylate cyclase (GGDEF)-like protein|nr:EAL domain-containing protein [Actinomycetota bacterium]